jgi:hypothetical protein
VVREVAQVKDLWMLARTEKGLQLIRDRMVDVGGMPVRQQWISCIRCSFELGGTELIHRTAVLSAGTREFCEAAKRLMEMPW